MNHIFLCGKPVLWCAEGELFAWVKREGFDAKCLLVVLITVGAGADQQQEFLYGELCVDRGSVILASYRWWWAAV